MDTIKCVFETKLNVTDLGKLNKIVGAVIPVSRENVLINAGDLGLYSHISPRSDYTKLKLALKAMTPTILKSIQGNQLLLTKPIHGQLYSIKNTGPFTWEKGDRLAMIPPVFSIQHTSVIQLGNWELILPMLVPLEVAKDINIRNIITTLLTVDKGLKDHETLQQELQRIHFRDVTVELPTVFDSRYVNNVRNICVSLSMIVNLSSALISNYIENLSLLETDVILVKCKELLNETNINETRAATNPSEEYKKIATILNLIVQIANIINETSCFIVLDVTPDNKLATCMFLQQ